MNLLVLVFLCLHKAEKNSLGTSYFVIKNLIIFALCLPHVSLCAGVCTRLGYASCALWQRQRLLSAIYQILWPRGHTRSRAVGACYGSGMHTYTVCVICLSLARACTFACCLMCARVRNGRLHIKYKEHNNGPLRSIGCGMRQLSDGSGRCWRTRTCHCGIRPRSSMSCINPF